MAIVCYVLRKGKMKIVLQLVGFVDGLLDGMLHYCFERNPVSLPPIKCSLFFGNKYNYIQGLGLGILTLTWMPIFSEKPRVHIGGFFCSQDLDRTVCIHVLPILQ